MSDSLLPTFGALTHNQIHKINENSLVLKYKKGELICRENHPVSHVLFLKTGLVKLFKEFSDDRSSIIGIIGPSRFFGLIPSDSARVYQISASAIEDSEVVHTNFDVFTDILFKNGKYACNLIDQISMYSLLLIDRMIMNTQRQIPGRIAELLLFFANKVYNSNTYTLPLSRQEIADFISATKETVSRTITEFKNDRLIEIKDKAITLTSIDLIERLSKIG